MILFFLLVIPMFGLVIWYTHSSNEKMIRSTASDYITSLKQTTSLKIGDIFEPSLTTLNSLVKLGTIDHKFFEKNNVFDYLVDILLANENILSIDIGLEDGSFRSVKKMLPGARVQETIVPEDTLYALRWIDKSSSDDNVYQYTFYNKDRKQTGQSSANEIYIPKTRDWYKAAVAANGVYVTDPRIKKGGEEGLSLSAPFFNNGIVSGVVAIDMTLDVLNDFLRTHLFNSNSLNLLIDRTGTVIASSDITDAAQEVNGQLVLKNVSELSTDIASTALYFGRNDSERSFTFFHPKRNNEEFVGILEPIAGTFPKKWSLLMVMPLSDFASQLRKSNQIILAIGLVALVLQIFIIAILSRYISYPLEMLTREVQDLINFRNGKSPVIRQNITEIYTLSQAIKRLRATISAFTSYIPRDLVNDLLKSEHGISLGGESRYLTILFSDLKDFSTLSEVTPSRELLARVSSYLELMTYAIKEEGGTVDKFIGDAVMAFWGAPLLNQNHAYHACVAAIKTQKRMVQLNERLISDGKPPLTVRIGIHSDAVLVGNIGSMERLSYTVMGDGVNIASRLEGINKEFGTKICISHALFKEAGERLWVRPIDQITVKGRKGELLIYELLGIRDGNAETQPTEAEKELCVLTSEAFESYLLGDYVKAKAHYESMVRQFDDPLSVNMIDKCDEKLKMSTIENESKSF